MPTQSRKLPCQDLLNGDGKDHYFKYGVPLYEASIQGDWKSAKAILDKKRELVRYSLTENSDTALHVAASANRCKPEFVKNIVGLMEEDDLTLQNKNHNTAFYLAAASGNLKTVQIMLKKNETLHTIPGQYGRLPLYAAALFGRKDVVKLLYSKTKDLSDDFGWNYFSRSFLLERCVDSDMFVFAFMGFREKESQALKLLRLLWEGIVKLPKKDIDAILKGPPDEIEQDKGSWDLQAIQLQELVSEQLKKLSEQLKELENTYKDEERILVSELKELVSRYMLKMHTETQNIIKDENKTRSFKGKKALELQKKISKYIVEFFNESQRKKKPKTLHDLISKHIKEMREAKYFNPSPDRYSSRVLFIAAEKGNTDFIVELIRRYPDLIWQLNDDGISIFHIAVRHRHADIYSLLYVIGAMKDFITHFKDINGNNMLHLVAKTVNRKQLKIHVLGALEMQREVLWFQEVESIVPPSLREQRNSDGLTPYELFTKEHKDMVTQGEQWMKDIATQCMVVAALIATMVFAAAFTVPGGYDQNNGIPIFHSKTTFKVFVVADAISLFSSSASILYMFLSVFTARYAERKFLQALPQKLIVGLSFLFLSMTSMIVALCVSFFVLYNKGLLWIPILISGCALIPFSIYAKAQYLLFVDVIRSKNLFKHKKHVLYHKNPTV